ncbi:rod shape-determining protein MreC [Glaciecola sp. MH2013]|uniref:rod shape-determining protein MreC n=1 Tax=Glaciecola sp. MH2013 TaxID=2785524 RepID=UPI00189D879E|nr:rod shape-determining protein MreC [Glaciecola sp. MH2013]MBF7073704.1 rod shape-determining protein MreC [Glaciecola sp. MH2013]
MNEVFARGPSLPVRLAIVLVLSLAAMLIDTKVENFAAARTYLNSMVSPLQYIANLPGEMMSWGAERFSSRQKLLADNKELTNRIALMNEQLQRFKILQQENNDLRKLLDAPVRDSVHKMITELMAVDTNPYSHQIVINKGAIDGVYLNQSVLDDNGIVGQVSEVGSTNSRVLLISDVTHAIPIRIERNNVRFIALGDGRLDSLKLQHVPHSADIQEGDVLVSSGLGDVFPEGYPVGVIEEIGRDESRPFADVRARPLAMLDRLKYLLLLWPSDQAPENAIGPDDQLLLESTINDATKSEGDL